jgi:flagellar assembly factor FliW
MTPDPPHSHRTEHAFDFPLGLPGFESERQFLLLEKREFNPLLILQSAARPELRFVCAPVQLLDSNYRLELAEDEAVLLGCGAPGCDSEPGTPRTLLQLAILTFPENGPPTANLLAPLVLKPETLRGVQSIQSLSDYSERHPLRRELPCS